jgi:hypothetical protein
MGLGLERDTDREERAAGLLLAVSLRLFSNAEPTLNVPLQFEAVLHPTCWPGRLDIRELGWADRERVLRLLFAKINNQAQQLHYARLPPHPLGDGAE